MKEHLRAARCTVVALTFALGSQAWAGSRSQGKSSQSELGVGMGLFTNGDFRGALVHFDAALAQAHTSEETAQVHLLRGQCFVALGDQPDARRAFELALDQNPEAHLDSSNSPPEMVGLLAEVRRGLHAELTLLGEGAIAKLDGATLGPLPIHQQIPIGRHSLEVTSPAGDHDQKQEFVARSNDVVTLSFERAGAPTPKPPSPVDTSPSQPTSPSKAPPAVVVPPPTVATTPAATEAPTLDLFGQVGALMDPVDHSLGFEAGAGVGRGPIVGSLSGIWGAVPGVAVRGGITLPRLASVFGVTASGEVPIFLASRTSVGLGIDAAVTARLGIVEPYVGASLQRFFSEPSSATPATYLVVPAGVRVHVP